VLNLSKGTFESNPVLYINLQLRYYLHMSSQEIHQLTDEEWAEHYVMLENIRVNEAKYYQPFHSH
jgi:hypothetical protein